LAEYQAFQEEKVQDEREICLMEEQEGEEALTKPRRRTLNVQRSP